MNSVDEFLQSVRDVFARNRSVDWTRIGLELAAAIAVIVGLSIWIGRRRARRALDGQVNAVVARAGLAAGDLESLTRMAAAVGLPPLEVMTQLAAFERATGAALASAPPTPAPTLRPADGSLFAELRRLRLALGFSPLSPHQWLLSTRELVAGDAVALGGVPGQVVDVNEATFAVELPAAAAPAADARVTLAIVRADDSRYVARVRVLAVEAAGADLRRAFFGHDDNPERQQHRQHFRVRVQGAVTVAVARPAAQRHVAPEVGSGSGNGSEAGNGNGNDGSHGNNGSISATSETIVGSLVDVSAGGLALELPVPADGPIVRGSVLRCSFTLGEGAVFEGLAAVVAAAGAGPRPNVQHLRLSFTSLREAERDRLASAVVAASRPKAPPPQT